MKISYIYTAGPIDGCEFDAATNWRDYVNLKMPSSIKTLSPMRGKQGLNDGKLLGKYYTGNPMITPAGINTRDHNDVYRCDLLFVNLLNATKVSIGTCMEIAWAHAYKKPIVIAMKPGDIHDHPMIKQCAGFIVDNIDQAIDVAIHVLADDDTLKQVYSGSRSSTIYDTHQK